MRYRRAFVEGGSYFFTVVTAQRRPILATEQAIEDLRSAFRNVRARRPFEIDAIVVLPDHLHCIWTLPPDDSDFATRWRLVKTWFTKNCDAGIRSAPIWQDRYWEHLMRDEGDFTRHVEYIHYNPVKHGRVARPTDWPYSSFGRYVEAGIYPADWGGSGVEELDLE